MNSPSSLQQARRAPLSLIYTSASNSSCDTDGKSSTNTFLCSLSHIHSPSSCPLQSWQWKIKASKINPILWWECTTGFAWADLNTISTKAPGWDTVWIEAAVSLQCKCSVWSEAKGRRSHMPGLHVVSAFRSGQAHQRKRKAAIQQTY